MKGLCFYIHKLIDFPEDKIIIARNNYTPNLSSEYIIVSEVSTVTKGKLFSYDDKTETENFNLYKSSNCTISFYGDNAKRNSERFEALQSSQLTHDLQRELKIAVFRSSEPNHIKSLDGSQWHEHWQVSIICDYTSIETIKTLRIDIPVVDFMENK